MNTCILPETIYIYTTFPLSGFNIEELVQYIKRKIPSQKIETRDLSYLWNSGACTIDYIAKRVASLRVSDSKEEIKATEPLLVEIEYEKKKILTQEKYTGVVYDGFRLQNLYKELIRKNEQRLSFCHIIFTNRLVATLDENDKRYHLRVIILGIPNIISASGIVEALAKPKEYHLHLQSGTPLEIVKNAFKKEIIDYNDSRITELLKGYCLQALFYHITGKSFCSDKGCRLYNAHYQKEALYAHIESPYEFCPAHSRIIRNLDKLYRGMV